MENIVQESQDKLEQGNRTNQQKMTQQKDDRNNNSDIIPVKPNSNIMHLNEVMIGVAGWGKDRACQENTTNLQEGVTKGGNLPHDGHEREYIDQNPDLRAKTSRKKQQRDGKQKMLKIYKDRNYGHS